ncbi:MAG: response regulator [Woeseiaceae bacterium]
MDMKSYEDAVKGTIVFVDDSRQLVDIATAMFEQLKCPIIGFTDPVLAADHIQSNSDKIRVVISDQSMPKVTGIELLQEAAKQTPKPYLVLSTGVLVDTSLDQYLALGIDAVLPKPFSLSDICGMLDRMLAA